MTFYFVYSLVMFLPGMLLVEALGIKASRFASSVALSFIFIALVLLLARWLGLGVQGFGYALLVGCFGVTLLGLKRSRWVRSELGSLLRWDPVKLVPITTMLLVLLYILWVGPYLEVPADAWLHIGRIQDWVQKATQGELGTLASVEDLMSKSTRTWYTLLGYFIYLTGVEFSSALNGIAIVNTMIFSGAIYSIALFVFQETEPSRVLRHWIAAATLFFFITHFGLSVFSYVRYYLYAPTMFNYVIYLVAVVFVLRFISGGHLRLLVLSALLCGIAAINHLQEAIFILVMAAGIVLFSAYRSYRVHNAFFTSIQRGDYSVLGREHVLFVVVLLTYVTAHGISYIAIERHDPLLHERMVDISVYVPFLRNLYILDPHYQFYQVITVWGVLVYVLFFISYKRFSDNGFLVVGMAIPILTVFNPVFTDLFLRYTHPHVLYRMCFMIPLAFIGGYFLVHSINSIRTHNSFITKSLNLVLAAALLALLFPIHTAFFQAPYSKVYTLKQVQPQNSYLIWGDLVAFLNTVEKTDVISDPVTGYVIDGLTNHDFEGYKFSHHALFRVNRSRYSAWMFNDKPGWLVVINERDGFVSDTGRVGGHWPQNIMKVSAGYSEEFKNYVTKQHKRFEKIWNRNNISVYRIN